MKKQRNIISVIDDFLAMFEFGDNKLTQLHSNINDNHFVKENKLKVSLSDIKDFLSWLRIGFLYVEKKWGSKSLPVNMNFCGESLPNGDPDIAFYVFKKDILLVSFFTIAIRADLRNRNIPVIPNLFPNKMMTAKSLVTLAAIEISFSSYLIKSGKVDSGDLERFLDTKEGFTKLIGVFNEAKIDLKINMHDCAQEDFKL